MALPIFLAIIPVIIILLYVYNRDKNKESLSALLKLFLSGILSCFVTLIITKLLGYILPFINNSDKNILEIIIYSFIVVALVEEMCKWVMVMLLGYNKDDIEESYDILIYAVFVSLGFAFIENLVCIINNPTTKLALVRGISAVPSHACNAVFMGYFLSIAKQYQLRRDLKNEKKYIILSIIIPTLLHGIYDFLIMSKIRYMRYLFIVFIIILYYVSIKRLRFASNNNEKMKKTDTFCKDCGKLLDGNICKHCGRVHNL